MKVQVCSRTGSPLCGIEEPGTCPLSKARHRTPGDQSCAALSSDYGETEPRVSRHLVQGLGRLATSASEVKSSSDFKGSNPRSLPAPAWEGVYQVSGQ